MQDTQEPGNDLIFGARNIAKWIGVPTRTVYTWHLRKLAPISKVGKLLVMSKRRFERQLAKD